MALFTERTYAAVSVSDICAAANVSRATFFLYFPARVYGDTVRNLLLCMGVPSPWGAPPMARFARVVVPGLQHNKPRYRG
jgi:hypothetical protein